MERVKSKNIFNYQLNGLLDDDVSIMKKRAKEAMYGNPEAKAMFDRVNSNDPSVDDSEAAYMLRGSMPAFANAVSAALKDAVEQCVHSELKVPLRDGNDFEVPVLIHTPKEKVDCNSNACVIYAHGGGAVAGNAEMMKAPLSKFAYETGTVFFNVDYRLAPETKCPKNVLDFYCAVKHIKENAEVLGVDPMRIAIAGDSGGAYVCFGAMVMMAQRNETDLVKLAIPGVPMISDYCFGHPAGMTVEEQESVYIIRRTWKCIAEDFEKQRNDPLLFPANASDEIITKMPPTIIWENEFDMFITEASRMANRMRRLGRLLEFRVQPGMTHESLFMPGTKGYEVVVRDYKLAVEQYLL